MSFTVPTAFLSLVLALPACGGDDDPALLGDVVRLDDASDEVLQIIADHLERDGATVSPTASELTGPTEGQELPSDTAATLTWTLATATAGPWYHGIDTGTFMWTRIDGEGLERPIDIVALTTTEYTISPTRWTTLIDAGGPFTATITTTVVDRGVVQSGPFQPAAATTNFTIAP